MKADELKNITLQQLEALVALVAEGTFSRAARRIHLSQPSLTKHIRNMENILNAPVVIRYKSGVALTPEGKIIYDYARKIIKLRAEAGEKIVRIQENEGGEITIAASSIPATYILPRTLSLFREMFPHIHVYIQSADSEEVLNMVDGGEREMGFVGKRPPPGKLEVEPLWTDRLVLAVPGTHRWLKEGTVALGELLSEPFIIREHGSGTRAILEQYLREEAHIAFSAFNIIAELGSSEAVKEAVLAGLGVSILSVRALERELRQSLLGTVSVADWRIERSFYLVYRRQFNFLRHHQLFLDFIRQRQPDTMI